MPDKKLTDSKKIAKWQKEKLGDKNYNEIQEKAKHDSEIIKALECCLETSGVNCGKCPYCDNCVTDENTSLMMTDVLDLINRLQEKDETRHKVFETKCEELEIVKAEKERLTAVKGYIDTLIHRDCEYPTVESYNEAFQKALARLYDNAKAKAEAYKEFADRAENAILPMLTTATLEEKETICFCLNKIKDLLKELERENNAD